MANVIYAPEADDDLIGIVDYIARDKPRAARDWLAKIRQACELLATQPGMGELREGVPEGSLRQCYDTVHVLLGSGVCRPCGR